MSQIPSGRHLPWVGSRQSFSRPAAPCRTSGRTESKQLGNRTIGRVPDSLTAFKSRSGIASRRVDRLAVRC